MRPVPIPVCANRADDVEIVPRTSPEIRVSLAALTVAVAVPS